MVNHQQLGKFSADYIVAEVKPEAQVWESVLKPEDRIAEGRKAVEDNLPAWAHSDNHSAEGIEAVVDTEAVEGMDSPVGMLPAWAPDRTAVEVGTESQTDHEQCCRFCR